MGCISTTNEMHYWLILHIFLVSLETSMRVYRFIVSLGNFKTHMFVMLDGFPKKCFNIHTLPETNTAPENKWFFRQKVSFREGKSQQPHLICVVSELDWLCFAPKPMGIPCCAINTCLQALKDLARTCAGQSESFWAQQVTIWGGLKWL